MCTRSWRVIEIAGALTAVLSVASAGLGSSVSAAPAQTPQGAVVSTLTAAPRSIMAMTAGHGGTLYVAAADGIQAWRDGRWQSVCRLRGPVAALVATAPNHLIAAAGSQIVQCSPGGTRVLYQASNTVFNIIGGLARSPDGTVYFDRHWQIYRLSPGGQVHLVAGEQKLQALAVGDPWLDLGATGRDGPGYLATFSHPGVLCWAPGLGLVVDDDQSLRWINTHDWVNTLLTSQPWGYADGPPVVASARAFSGLGCDASGNVYFTDGPDQRLRVWLHATNEVRTVAGSGTRAIVYQAMGSSHVTGLKGGVRNGPGHWAEFENPSLVAVAPHGRIYVLDQSGLRLVTLQDASQGGAPTLSVPANASADNSALPAVTPVDLPLGVHNVRLYLNGRLVPGAAGLPGGAFPMRAGTRLRFAYVAGGTTRMSPSVTLKPGGDQNVNLPYFAWSLPPSGSWLRGVFPITILNPSSAPIKVLAGDRVVGSGSGLLVHLNWRSAKWPDGSIKVSLPMPADLGPARRGDILATKLRLVNQALPAKVSSQCGR